ncbi:NatC N(alpha)-terminal acetyltransferase, Mak10 subunit, putative [Bodo saltans]|uniref:NatC N(Alpha)-terminal acetyltransferase, Mak10 subunit, putative n=1 Tax=Bodo saltans TaxID=75058 RepID=A0A0S4IMZ6_BODSA|nr:NatC N(alpha)-terminal acetyltransferase, Mak10 subunit, putative [Bodo saltans]|eukprot:CUF57420.1 NatC N(alpha)-terminal acetyltransferase, Mak10 subunit, putative [Bodo saltans]
MTAAGDVDNTWVECLAAYKAEVAAMRLWDTVCMEGIDAEQLLSSPEVLDPKTDTGYEWSKHGTASGFFASSSLTNVAKLSEAQLLETVDALFSMEVLFLRGRHLLQGLYRFVYFLRMHELKEKNAVLYAYCRGVLRTIDFVARTTGMTSVREDEEFPSLPGEINTQGDCPLTEIVVELDAAIATVTNEALKQRLTFRKQLLRLFFEVFVAEQSKSIAGVVTACTEGLATLTTLKRDSAPALDAGLFRNEMAVWLSSDIPIAAAALPEFQETVDAYRTMFEQVLSTRVLFTPTGRTLAGVTDFIESLGAKKPLLPTRTITVLLLFGENANVSFLHQGSLPILILETLANLHGAPLYGKVVEGDENVQKEIAYFCGHRQNAAAFGRHMTEAVRRWVSRATRVYLTFWEALLCSRGRTHRRLANLIEELGGLQMTSFDIDTGVFQAQRTGLADSVATQADREMISRSLVLTAFVVELTCHVMSSVLHLMVELQLLSKAEYTAWAVYNSHVNSARIENLSVLYLGLNHNNRVPIPERRLTRTGVPAVNPVLSMRFPTTPSPLLLSRLDGNGVLADVLFRAAVILESKGQLDLSSPATSLIPISQTFHNRMKVFARVQRPAFMTFDHCEEQKKLFLAAYAKQAEEKLATGAAESAALELTGIATVAKQVADRTKQALGQVPAGQPVFSLQDLERAARATYVSLNLLSTLKPEALAAFELTLGAPSGAPGHLAVVMMKRKQ